MFSPSQSPLGENPLLQPQLWTMALLLGANHQLEDGVMVGVSPLDPMAGPMDPQVLHPASQVTLKKVFIAADDDGGMESTV